jgi:hypothetical protein
VAREEREVVCLLHAEGKVEGDLTVLLLGIAGLLLLLGFVGRLLLLLGASSTAGLGIDEGKECVARESFDGRDQVVLCEQLVRHQPHCRPSHALI